MLHMYTHTWSTYPQHINKIIVLIICHILLLITRCNNISTGYLIASK